MILYEILTLTPLRSGTSTADFRPQILNKSYASPREDFPNLNTAPELDAICVKATAQNISNRYSSLSSLIQDLESYLEGNRDVKKRRLLANDHAAGMPTS